MISPSNAADGLEPPGNNNEDFSFITDMSLPDNKNEDFNFNTDMPLPLFDVASTPVANGGVDPTPNLCPAGSSGDQSPGNLQSRQTCYPITNGLTIDQIAPPHAQNSKPGANQPPAKGKQRSPFQQVRPSDSQEQPVAQPNDLTPTYHDECQQFFGGIFKFAVCDTGDWRPIISTTFIVYELIDCMLSRFKRESRLNSDDDFDKLTIAV